MISQHGFGRERIATLASSRHLQFLPIVFVIAALLLAALAAPAASSAASYTFTPVADSYTRSDNAAANYGTAKRMSARNYSRQLRHSYLRFNVALLPTEAVTRATLVLYAATGGSNISLRDVSSDTWSETGLTWNSAPVFSIDIASTVAAVAKGKTASFDAGDLVTGAGFASMALTTTSKSAVSFHTRESSTSYRPRLIVQTGLEAPDPGTPPPPAADTTAPETVITSAPETPTTATSANFSFTGADDSTAPGSLSFECSADGSAYAPCAPIKTYTPVDVGDHSFAVRAIDDAGNTDPTPAQESWAVTPQPDTTPPSAPADLTASAGDSQVALSWNAASDNVAVAGYRVYRDGVQVATPTGTTYADTGRTNGASYSYSVRAVDAAGNMSTSSNTASATPTAPPPPPPPPPPPSDCPLFGPYTTATVPGACWRPYAAASPFNRPVPANPPLYSDSARNTNSAKVISRLMSWGTGQSFIAGQTGSSDWWHPLYYSKATDPLYTIRCTQWTSSCELEGRQVRIPAGAKPAGGGDGHMTVIDQATGTEYDMWQAATPSGSGGTLNVSHGGITQIDGDGLGSNATAAHFGLAAGPIRGAEMQAGNIPHALFSQIKCSGGYAVYPAAPGTSAAPCTNFGLSNQDAPPMGARLWLDYTPAQIDAMNLPAWKKVILKAMNAYGIIIGDTNGGNQSWGIQAESEQGYASFGRTSYWKTLGQQTGAGGYGGGYVFDLMSGVDWAGHLRVLDPCVSQGSCS